MAQQNSNTGSITIRELASAFNSENHLEYRQLIDSAHLPTKMRQFLLRKQYYIRFQEDCAQFRENQLAVMENMLSEQTAKVEASLNALEVSEKEVESARKELAEAQRAYQSAFIRLTNQQDIYDKALAKHRQNQDCFNRGSTKQEDQERLVKKAQKLLKEAQNYVLIHSSATVSSISKKVGILVCTQHDADELHFHKHVDQVIDIPENNYADLIPDNARTFFGSDEEFESAIAYVELVLKFFFESRQYELLYNSDGIDKLLNSVM